jgi:hypothetical protein
VKMHAHWRVVREAACCSCGSRMADKHVHLDSRVCSCSRQVYNIVLWQRESSAGVLGVGNAVLGARSMDLVIVEAG